MFVACLISLANNDFFVCSRPLVADAAAAALAVEATVIIIDTSEYMRNGDCSPTRFEAQRDAVNIVANAKTESNAESTVALMKMSAGCVKSRRFVVLFVRHVGESRGRLFFLSSSFSFNENALVSCALFFFSFVARRAQTRSCAPLSTLTTDIGKILNAMHNVELKGNVQFVRALDIAQVCIANCTRCVATILMFRFCRCAQPKLVLKNRQNKSQKQRVVAFVGSPIDDDKKELVGARALALSLFA